MTNIMQCIRNMESTKRVPVSLYEDAVAEGKQFAVERDEARTALNMHEGCVVLDPDKDPDPYGNFGMPLSYRLRCMGWPEGLS